MSIVTFKVCDQVKFEVYKASCFYRLLCSVDVRQNLLSVFSGDGSTDCGLLTERISNLHCLSPCHQSRNKPFPDVLVNKHPCAVGTHLHMIKTGNHSNKL